MKQRWLVRCLGVFCLFIIVGLYVPAFIKPRQPVVLFYIEDGRADEDGLRAIARDLTAKYRMRFHTEYFSRPDEDIHTIFAATNNGWLYRFALVRGSEPQFDITFVERKFRIIVDGAPEHPEVHKLVADWISSLNAAKIKYKIEIRTPLILSVAATVQRAHDAANRVTKRVLPDGSAETFEYDSVGNLISHVGFNGNPTALSIAATAASAVAYAASVVSPPNFSS